MISLVCAQQATQLSPRVQPAAVVAWATRDDQDIDAALVDPTDFDVLATLAHDGDEPALGQHVESIDYEFVGAAHDDARPCALRASTRARKGSAVPVGSIAIRFLRG